MKGTTLLRQAADMEDTTALFALGAMYALGDGVEQNYVEAAGLYRRAVDKRHVGVLYILGQMHMREWI